MFALLRDDGPEGRVLAAARGVLGDDPRRIAPEQWHRNDIGQPLVAAVQLATWAALRERLPPIRAFAGYSVGELTAYGCAGALDDGAILRLARHRAAAMDTASAEPGGLCAVRGVARREIDRLCEQHRVEIAIVNGPDRLVLGGRLSELTPCQADLAARGAKVTLLRVTIASHTSRMAPAVDPFRAALFASALRDPEVPVLAGIDGTPVFRRERAIDVLSRQLATTVAWSSCLEGLVEMGCSALLELGPGSGLTRMVRDRYPDLPARSVEEFRSVDGVVAWALNATAR
jgi:[acyl-carrier-protein] S-malonyltransferase